jgi:arsenate reductase/ArsR family transcriptional regulator
MPNKKRTTSNTAAPPTVPLDALVEAAKALGHPARLRVLAMLREGPLCVCQITSVLGVAASTVSAHLADLRRAGLVAEQKQGKWVYYRLAEGGPLDALVREVRRLAAGDAQLREDARVIRAVRGVPVEDFCRSGLDLATIGVTRHDR